jgi:hypothetical protein
MDKVLRTPDEVGQAKGAGLGGLESVPIGEEYDEMT